MNEKGFEGLKEKRVGEKEPGANLAVREDRMEHKINPAESELLYLISIRSAHELRRPSF